MSDQSGDTGSKDRATVAVVSEKVTGLTDLVRLSFENVQRQLDLLAGLPARMATLEERQSGISARQDATEKRMDAVEKRETDDLTTDRTLDRTFLRVNLPSIIISGLALVVAAASLVVFLILNL